MEERLTNMGTWIANNDPLLGGISQSKHVVWKWIRICIHHPVFYFNDNYSLRRETTRVNPHSHMQHGWKSYMCVCKEKTRNWNVCLSSQPLNNQKHAAKGQYNQYPQHTQEQSLPIFSGPMHVQRECALTFWHNLLIESTEPSVPVKIPSFKSERSASYEAPTKHQHPVWAVDVRLTRKIEPTS